MDRDRNWERTRRAFDLPIRCVVQPPDSWIDEYGDQDRDGYVEYSTRSAQGLGNQCWRDSWDGIQFADGSIPVLPIATCDWITWKPAPSGSADGSRNDSSRRRW